MSNKNTTKSDESENKVKIIKKDSERFKKDPKGSRRL